MLFQLHQVVWSLWKGLLEESLKPGELTRVDSGGLMQQGKHSLGHLFMAWHIVRPKTIPTVCLGATYVVAYTYGYDGGRIEPTHCALIDAGLGDRSRQRRACSRPPAEAGSARIGLVAGSRPGATAAPGGFHQSRTTPPAATRSCGDASRARCAPDTHPCRLRPCLVENSLQYRHLLRSPAPGLPAMVL